MTNHNGDFRSFDSYHGLWPWARPSASSGLVPSPSTHFVRSGSRAQSRDEAKPSRGTRSGFRPTGVRRDTTGSARGAPFSIFDPSTRTTAFGRGLAQDSAPRVVEKVPRALPVGLHFRLKRNSSSDTRHSPSREWGGLLVITLWMVILLSMLAVSIARHLSIEIRLAKYRFAREQAKILARSGIYLAMQRLATDAQEEGYDWLGDDWASFPKEGATSEASLWTVWLTEQAKALSPKASRVEIRVVDGQRYLDVNSASVQQISLLLNSLEAAEAIVDYYDPDEDGPGEQVIGDPPYTPKNAPVVVLEELLDVPQVTRDLFQVLLERTLVVPQRTSGWAVNINTAEAEVLQAVGLETLADSIVEFRKRGHYFTQLAPTIETEDPTVPAPFDASHTEFLNAQERLCVASEFFVVKAIGRIFNPEVQVPLEVLMQRTLGQPQLPRILAWKEG